MRLSEIRDEQALEVMADIIDPLVEISKDPDVVSMARSRGNRLALVTKLLRDYKRPIIAILAALDGERVEDYHFNLLTLPKKLMDLIEDPEVMSLFQSQGQTMESPSFGSATGNTEGENA